MQKLGLLALAVSAAAWASSATAESQEASSDLVQQLNQAAKAAGVKATPNEHALSKRIYLYHYLSGDQFAALTDSHTGLSLLDDDVLGTVPDSLMGLGMDSHAVAMMDDKGIAAKPGTAITWFALAQRASENDRWPEAAQLAGHALDESGLLTADQVQEAHYIRVTANAQQNQLGVARSELDSMTAGTRWQSFARYNLMLAMMRNKVDSAELAKFIQNEVSTTPDDYNARSLRDRFLVTAGRYEIRQKHYPEAISYLRNVSKDSSATADGLLQYGWALSKQWQYDQALQPWRVLQDNYPIVNLSVLESLMATAYVAELMQGGIKSLHVYEYAEKGMLNGLDQIETLNNDELLLAWVQQWAQGLPTATDNSTTVLHPALQNLQDDRTSRALISLFSTTPFITAQQQLQDVVAMQNWVAERKAHLQQLQKKAGDNNNRFNEGTLLTDINAATDRLHELDTGILASVETLRNEYKQPIRFVTDDEKAEIAHIEALAVEAGTDSDTAVEQAEHARMLAGLVKWQIHEQEPERRAAAEADLRARQQQARALNEQIIAARTMYDQMASFYANTDSHLNSMAATYTKLEQLEQHLAQLRSEQEMRVVATAREHLDMLKSRLRNYLATTRLSIARLYDTELRRNAKTGGLGDDQ